MLERDVASRDLAALSAVFVFWGRATVTSAGGEPANPERSSEPLLAGDLERFARAAGLTAFAFHGTLEDVVYELHAGRPVIVGVADATRELGRSHYEVVVACDPRGRRLRNLDPARGFIERSYTSFESEWQPARQLTLVMFASEDFSLSQDDRKRARPARPEKQRALASVGSPPPKGFPQGL